MVQSDRGHTVLVSGEAGIGKSRLVNEVHLRVQRLGWQRLQGQCFEADRTLPFAPLLDVLRAVIARQAPEDRAAQLGATAHDLAHLLPELTMLIPELPIRLMPPSDPQQDKRRLFQALTHFLGQPAGLHPLLLVVEDVHWSDDTSLEYLLYLARQIATQPILLLITYRSDEIHPALQQFLAELDRARLATQVSLPRLSLSETNAMLSGILDLSGPVRPEFGDAIYALTEGNPFFIEEVLQSLTVDGWLADGNTIGNGRHLRELRVPRSVQAAVQRRLDQVSPAARQMLAVAAVAGRRFDFGILEAVLQCSEAELLGWLKEVIAAHLVVEETADQFAFRHALTRQAIYLQLLGRERKVLHQKIADAMERIYAGVLGAHVVDLVHHWYEAGVWTKVLDYAQQAGTGAQALWAPRAAIEHFNRALEAARQLSLAPLPGLYRERGKAYETLGDFEHAQADYQALLQGARASGDRQAEWQALLDLGMLWAARDYARTGEYLQQALDLARVMQEPRSLAHSLNRMGNWHLNVERPLEALHYHPEALAIFEALNDRSGMAETLDLLGMANLISGDLLQATRWYEQAMALFRELDDRQGLASALATLAACGTNYTTHTVIPAVTSSAETVRVGELAVQTAREMGWRAGEAYALGTLGLCLGPQGSYAQALEVAQNALAIAQEIEHRQWMAVGHYVCGVLYLDLLALPAARQHLEQALAIAQKIGSWHLVRLATGYLASVCLLQQEPNRAEAVLDAALGGDAPSQTLGQRLCWYARAQHALARGDSIVAMHIVDRLITSAANLVGEGGIPHLLTLRGEVLTALQRRSEAEASLQAALQQAVTLGDCSLRWRIHVALGTFYTGQARSDDANREFEAARTIIKELGTNIHDVSLRDHFLHSAIVALPLTPARRPTRRATTSNTLDGLTRREREVAELIAHGLTNRQIAGQLVISETTVEVHVKHILSKLQFGSRTQIAAWAVHEGLATSSAQDSSS